MNTAAPALPVVGRMAGFVGFLRHNGFTVGPAETAEALALTTRLGPDAGSTRLGLKTALCGTRRDWDAFDTLFDAYWFGRERTRLRPRKEHTERPPPALWSSVLGVEEGQAPTAPVATTPDAGASERSDDGLPAGRTLASARERLFTTDLRQLVAQEDIAAAEALAERLAAAMAYRLSRRRRAASRGTGIDLRRTIRRNLGHGGEPLDLLYRRRPMRPVRVVALLDVSGSMESYSRFFLLFLRGLITRWLQADAYLFHTRLLRITDVFKDKDPLRAMGRLSLMAEGFNGGTRIAHCLDVFTARHGAHAIDSRTVVVIISDGYDTDEPAVLGAALARLKKRARRLVWLNPVAGWRDYAPVAQGMAAALPYIDLFAPAHTLKALGALESELARL